ncbi:ATP synthase F0 subunit C [candidate division KSB1 bacterium]|nr:ATP synthase F0 subunit C [candidate division KSB1 bacterium]
MGDLGLAYLAAGLGAGISVIGGALGIGKLAGAAMDGISRQPEAARLLERPRETSGLRKAIRLGCPL